MLKGVGGDGVSQKIYIVEDDASIRELESYALKSAGFETLGFENSRDFFAQMESHLPDLILLDIMLPGTDGLKVLETIRSTPRLQQTAGDPGYCQNRRDRRS